MRPSISAGDIAGRLGGTAAAAAATVVGPVVGGAMVTAVSTGGSGGLGPAAGPVPLSTARRGAAAELLGVKMLESMRRLMLPPLSSWDRSSSSTCNGNLLNYLAFQVCSQAMGCFRIIV